MIAKKKKINLHSDSVGNAAYRIPDQCTLFILIKIPSINTDQNFEKFYEIYKEQ